MDTSSVVAHRGLPVTLAPSLAGGWHLIIARWLAGTRAQGAILPRLWPRRRGADASLSHLSHPSPRIQGPRPEGNRSLTTAGIPAAATRGQPGGKPQRAAATLPGLQAREAAGVPISPASMRARSRAWKRPSSPAPSGEANPRCPLLRQALFQPRRAAPGSGQLPPVCSALLAVPRPPRPPGSASSCKYGGARPPRRDPQV